MQRRYPLHISKKFKKTKEYELVMKVIMKKIQETPILAESENYINKPDLNGNQL